MTTQDIAGRTEGPWHVDTKRPKNSYFEDVNILRGDGLAVAVAVHNGGIDPAEVKQAAHLIAAAPDLVKVLEECSNFLRDLTDPDKKASGPNIIATFGNALALSTKVTAALAAAKTTGDA